MAPVKDVADLAFGQLAHPGFGACHEHDRHVGEEDFRITRGLLPIVERTPGPPEKVLPGAVDPTLVLGRFLGHRENKALRPRILGQKFYEFLDYFRRRAGPGDHLGPGRGVRRRHRCHQTGYENGNTRGNKPVACNLNATDLPLVCHAPSPHAIAPTGSRPRTACTKRPEQTMVFILVSFMQMSIGNSRV